MIPQKSKKIEKKGPFSLKVLNANINSLRVLKLYMQYHYVLANDLITAFFWSYHRIFCICFVDSNQKFKDMFNERVLMLFY